MFHMKKNYLFFINGQVRTSVKGEKVQKKDSLRNVRKYFTPDYDEQKMRSVIIELLEEWSNKNK